MTELYESRRSERVAPVRPGASPWIVVATVAILAGVGVATLGNDEPGTVAPATRRTGAHVLTEAPRMIELTFNPRTLRGTKVAKVAFRFRYEYDPADRELLAARVDEMWRVVCSRILRRLMQYSAEELVTEEEDGLVERGLKATIDETLFPDGRAACHSIIWGQIFVQ